ncbi:MAG: hypothetical protein GF398_11545 [Chitinivibrionales bacterium]|nr:hypothetical protein [Chitinivibrionales bacterium]
MPRKPRIIVPGSAHHVMARGIDGEKAYRDDADRERFVRTLQKYLGDGETPCRCYAWALMDNHYHLLLRPLDPGLGIMMRKVNGSYARYFNARHGRRGYLFGDRYKSIATQELGYVREIIRYIHLNPLRANIVKSLDDLAKYPWTGHRAMLGLERVDWHDSESALSRFGRTRQAARGAYLSFLSDGIGCELQGWRFGQESKQEGDSYEVFDDRLAGDADFVRKALGRSVEPRNARLEKIRRRPTLDKIMANVCGEYRVELEQVLKRGRGDSRSFARASFCRKAVQQHCFTLREVAVYLGVNASSVLKMCRRR